MVDVRPTTLAEVWSMGRSLLLAHGEEANQPTGLLRDERVPPAWVDAERVGNLLVLGVFAPNEHAASRDVMVGYSIGHYAVHPFNPAEWMYVNDLFYVAKAFRGMLIGPRLARATERIAKASKDVRCWWPVPSGSEMAKVLERIGYQPTETIYERAEV